jgi:hypothetical protein
MEQDFSLFRPEINIKIAVVLLRPREDYRNETLLTRMLDREDAGMVLGP